MKITREVRDFAAKQNSESYLAATAPVADAEAGMGEMSRVYSETGRELYIGHDDREHDGGVSDLSCLLELVKELLLSKPAH